MILFYGNFVWCRFVYFGVGNVKIGVEFVGDEEDDYDD